MRINETARDQPCPAPCDPAHACPGCHLHRERIVALVNADAAPWSPADGFRVWDVTRADRERDA